jgi:uncharacterized membrane protein
VHRSGAGSWIPFAVRSKFHDGDPNHPAMPGSRILGFTVFLLGGVAYLTFLFTIMYASGFVSGLVVPKTIDTGPESGLFEAIVVNLILLSLLAVQHSVMARKLNVRRSISPVPRARLDLLFPWRKLT